MLARSDPVPSWWSYLGANQVPTQSLVPTRLTCSDLVHSQFRSCLKRIRIWLAAGPVLCGLRLQLWPLSTTTHSLPTVDNDSSPQPNPVSFADFVPAFTVDLPARSWFRFPSPTTFLPSQSILHRLPSIRQRARSTPATTIYPATSLTDFSNTIGLHPADPTPNTVVIQHPRSSTKFTFHVWFVK